MNTQDVKKIIIDHFLSEVRFTADDIYQSPHDVPDLPMYDALKELVLDGTIQERHCFDDRSHATMTYAVAGEAGYRSCFCRDCFNITIGVPGEMCHECEEAGCEPKCECEAPGAYGGFVE